MDLSRTGLRFLVKDFGAMYDFYTGVMGLAPVWGGREGPYASFAAPGAEAPTFALFQAENMTRYEGYTLPAGGHADTLQLVVPSKDVDADYERLKALGASFLGPPQSIEDWGMRCAVLRDPEGNLIEINDSGSA